MLRAATLFSTGLAAVAAGLEDPFAAGLLATMQPTVTAMATKYKCAIAAAVRFPNGTRVSVVSGEKDYVKKSPAVITDRFVWGSVTKTLTGTNILKAQEAGLLKITDPIVKYVDPLLAKMNASDPTMNFGSLEELFGAEVTKVTIENLAQMKSGIPDYDTATPDHKPPVDAFRAQCYKNATTDYRPQDILSTPWVAKHTLEFAPGTKMQYSSTNFVLLGLVLAEVYGHTWLSFNQGDVIPSVDRKDTVFATTGPPSSHTQMHGYDRTSYNGQNPSALPGKDVFDTDCVYAGWTASDYTASVQDAADMTFDIYGPKSPILSPESQKIMVPAEDPKGAYLSYSFATFNLNRYAGYPWSDPRGKAWGHLGATYGYDSVTVFYPELNMSMAIASNIETLHQTQPADTLCQLWNEVRSYTLNETKSSCTFDDTGYFGLCTCK